MHQKCTRVVLVGGLRAHRTACRPHYAILDTIMRPGGAHHSVAGCIRIPGAAFAIACAVDVFFLPVLFFLRYEKQRGITRWVLRSDVTDFWHFLSLGLGSGGEQTRLLRGPSKLPLISLKSDTHSRPTGNLLHFKRLGYLHLSPL
jgi:hypothetical protein